jgi:S-methylmethionine-dependent homocysteine/selenocysteine methylase
MVRAVHAEYVAAGADVLTTNTFVLTPYHMEAIGRTAQLIPLVQAACQRAREAVEAGGRPGVRVAGSLPPLKDWCAAAAALRRPRGEKADVAAGWASPSSQSVVSNQGAGLWEQPRAAHGAPLGSCAGHMCFR